MNAVQFSSALGKVNDKYIMEAITYKKKKKSNWLKWGTMAACLALVVVLGYVSLQRVLFDNDNYIVTLESGDTINFVKSDRATNLTQLNANVTTRELTQAELYTLFGDLPVTGDIFWNELYNVLLGFSGRIGTVKLVIAAPNAPLLDTVVVGSEKATEIDGVSVTAGYFLTKPNSEEIRTSIFYASFELGEWVLYVENAGPESESETISSNLAATIYDLIKNGEPDLSQITLNQQLPDKGSVPTEYPDTAIAPGFDLDEPAAP